MDADEGGSWWGATVHADALQTWTSRLLVEDVYTPSVRRASRCRSVNRLTVSPAKTLAHLHRQPRSTSYFSKAFVLFFPRTRTHLMPTACNASPFEDAQRTADSVCLDSRTTEAGLPSSGARSMRQCRPRSRSVKRGHAPYFSFFPARDHRTPIPFTILSASASV